MASGDSINFLLLVELIVVVIVASAFLFYWNRLFAWVFAWCIRLYTWRVHNAHISIESLQISPLAGRISFRSLEYHSSNLSLRALHGHVTFRYWKLRVRQEADSQSSNIKRNRLPCRVCVTAEGVEGFVFNRTPAYDGIVERMKKYEEAQKANEKLSEDSGDARPGDLGKTTSGKEHFGARLRRPKGTKEDKLDNGLQQSQSSASSGSTPSKPTDATHELPSNPKPPKIATPEGVNWFRELVPLEIRIVTGSMILGNDATPMLLIGDFKSAEGTLEVSDSRSACDDYKMTMDLRFEAPKVLMRTNVDYSGPLLAHGKKAYDELYKKDPDVAKQPPSKLSSFPYFQTLARKFSFLQDPKFSSPPVVGLPHDKVWKGLARYRLDESGTAKTRKKEEREYAKVTTLLDSPALDLTYYADSPGLVPDPSEAEIIDKSDEFGNVEPPPEYGIDIAVHGGTIKYGPWADRQRDALQKAFAPAIFFHSDPKPRLQPGDTRVHTALLLNLTLTEETTLRIPTREPSKDWSFDNAPAGIERRYGWLDVTVGPNSSITYTQSQLATKHGYDAMLVLHLDSLSIASSVNLETFIISKTCRVSMTMPTPLRWDAQRDWGLDIALDTIDVTLLRDHVQLISDLARDWSSGAVGDFHHFVPNHYNFRVILVNYAFHLYINDFNIVNRPRSREDNAFMDVYGPAMSCYIAVAATQFRPEFSVVPFSVTTHDARVELCSPVWDTQRSFGSGDTIEIGKIGQLSASGNYRYYAVPRPEHQEALTLHLEAKRVVYKMLGWSLRRLFCVKDNYFGTFTQFTTMQEYLERFDHDPESVGDPIDDKYRPGRSDPFSAQVTMNVEESLILLSDQIYGCASGLAMPVPQLQMALRSTNHYLDLSLDALPTYVVPMKDFQGVYAKGEAPPPGTRETFFIEGIEVKAHRLFGPQPRATTYVCIWEINVPRITAFSSPAMHRTIHSVRQAILYTFQDFDNAPAEIYIPKTPPDVTFVKVGMGEISMTVFDTDTAFSVHMPEGINVDTSTWATRAYQAAIALVIPKIALRLLSRANDDWITLSSVDLDLSLNVFNAPRGWHDHVENQQVFIRAQDGPTGRVKFMYTVDDLDGMSHADGQYLPTPWTSFEDYEESEASSMSDAASAMVDLSSSMGSDGEASPERRSVRPRSRARSWATARQGSQDSLTATDVSDTSTETGSTSGDSTHKPSTVHDMPGALAESLARFKSFQQSLGHAYEGGDLDVPTETLSFGTQSGVADGRIVRILLRSIRVDAAATAVISGARLFRSLSQLSESPERLLDNLLLWQIRPLITIVKAEPFMVDVTLPRMVARVTIGDSPAMASALDIDMRGVQTRVLQNPTAEDDQSKSDIMVAARNLSLAVTSAARTGKTYLDSTKSNIAASYPNRVFNLSLTQSHVAISPAGSKIAVHQRYGNVEMSFVNSALDVVSSWLGTISDIRTEIADFNTRPRPYVAMLYRICRAAEDADITLSIPQFMSETAYGLHIQDQRSMRQDLGWILLAKLRHWYRLSGHYYRRSDTPNEDMARDLVRGLASMEEAADGEEALIARQGFIQHALGSLAKQTHPGEAEEQKAINVMLYAGDLKLHHHGPGLEGRPSPTNLVRVSSASFGVHLNTHQRDAMPASNTRILAALKSLELDLHNSLLPLVDHLQPLKDALLKPRPQDDTQQAEIRSLLLDLQCETMKLGVSAAGLKGSITLEKHHTSLSHRAEARRRGSDLDRHHQILVMLDSNKAEVAVFQPQIDSPDGKVPVDRMVILVGARGHEIVLETHDHFDADKPKSIKVIMGLQHFEVDSRPQLRHFLTFAREWKTQHFPTYAPYLRRFSTSESSDRVDRPHGPLCAPIPAIVQVDFSFHSGQIQIRAAKAVWLRWELAKIFLTQRCTNRTTRFGIKIAPQLVGAYESPKKKDSSGAVLRLPSIAATGTFRLLEHEPQLSTSVQLGFFTGIIKPAMLDRLLLLHQRLGRDMEQLIKEYAVRPDMSASTSASSSLAPPSPPSEAAKSSRLPIRLEVRCGIEGVRFGLRADDVATTLLFEALALTAQASNTHDEEASLSWRAKANHFGLSLGHLGTGALSVDTEPMKKHRSAYMVLDVDVQEIPASETTSSKLNVYLNRVHTVMHIAALSELSDLVKSWQSDLHILRDNRATEVAEVKHTTSRFFKKLDPGEKSNTENSWFATRLLSVHVAGLGLAIPLLDSKAISSQRKEELHGVPALLFSIRAIDFMNRRNETARFKVQRMALQFINKFDQGVSEHFSGDFHPSSNRMSLPTLESEAQMSSKEDAWTLSAHCAATDFRLSLAPDVADGVFRLMDLYEQGRDRFLELERNYRSEDATATERLDSVALKYDDEVSPISPRKSQRIIIRMSYTFNSGIVELHRLVAHELKKTSRRTNWLDIFHLPTISLWVDFEGAKTESLPHTTIESDAAQLIFSCAVHESRNTLRPSILPFFVELTNRIQQRVRQNNQGKPSPPKEPKAVSEPLTAALSESKLQIIAPSKGAVDVRVSLRIDRSELRFSCAPDSNAYADLKWESGGFLATTTLGKSGVSTVAGSISDITSTLSHEFAESGNACVEAGAKDMAFAVTLCPGEGPTHSGVSVVFDTQLSGQFRLDAFSSWLIFIAVWVDDAPQLDILDHHESIVASSSATPVIEIPTSASQVGGLHQVHRHKLAVAILARFRCIDFDANIGVSRTHLEISPILLRTTSNGERTEVDVRVGTTKVSAKGDISGELTSQGLVFNTMRRSSRASSDFDATVLSMAIEGGDLSGSLFLADTNILRFHLEPTTVSLADDWQAFTRDPSAQVFLSFTVKAGLFQGVLRLLSIPRLLGNLYSIIDMAESQSVIAAQRSEIFKSARSRRKTEPSPVAAILLQSAAKKVASSPSTVKTAQTMRFDLAGIDVGLFNEDYEQGHVFEFYRFIVGKVEADLKRQLSKDHLPTRDLGLLVAFVRWDNSDGARVAAQEKPSMTAGEMIEAATRVGRSEVASLPVMTLVMNSIEYNDPQVLDFDFDLTWGETDGDVKILPSFFEQAYVAFDKLIKGLDEQEMARAKRSEPEDESTTLDTESYKRKTMDEITSGANTMEFRNRDPTKAEKVPIPRLKMLGEGTGDAAKLVPKIRSGVKELPKLSHRFVTLPLEEGMDLLLKLYEKQLPETAG